MNIQLKFLIYYILMFITAIIGIASFRRKENLRSLFVLVPISLFTEILVEYLIIKGSNYYPVYHFYEVIDFFFLCLLYYQNRDSSALRKSPVFFFAGFLICLAVIYAFTPTVSDYPSVQYAVESFLLINMSLWYLLTIEPQPGTTLPTTGMFWIASGIILSHSGIFIINGSFNYLITTTAKLGVLKDWINMAFNYLLYIFFITGIVCQKSSRK